MTSWAHTILDATGRLMLVTSHGADGRDAFYFLLLSKAQRAAFLEAMDLSEPIDLTQFGRIVHSGWGNPTAADKEFVRKNYQADV